MSRNKRIRNLVLFIVFFVIETLIALYVHDAFIRPYVGDMLVVVLVYFFVGIFITSESLWIPFYIFLFASGVEVLQYFEIVKRIGLENNKILRVMIGSIFDWKDIVCYGTGCLIISMILRVKEKRSRH